MATRRERISLGFARIVVKLNELNIALANLTNANLLSSTDNIVKNTSYAIAATNKIVSVTIYNPSNGKTYSPQLMLASDRLSGSFKLPYSITNAEIDIITR